MANASQKTRKSESQEEDYNVYPITITYLNECFQIEEHDVASKNSESESNKKMVNARFSKVQNNNYDINR